MSALAFNPSRGGRAPPDIRRRFAELVDRYVIDQRMTPNEDRELNSLAGKLWNCTDRIPGLLRSDIEELSQTFDKPARNYAQAARIVRAHIRKATAEPKSLEAILAEVPRYKPNVIDGEFVMVEVPCDPYDEVIALLDRLMAPKPRVRVKAISRLLTV
ncbi:hypothetical protein [Aureimonas psammosilenae]|uniref:hypothetical protein n=1 Tax=Aureimonas psammosilenae TaxID=2495496 RepID=UPI001260D38C|nr:hypothetical protein [Aureimonas psammosilenae]